MPKGVSNKAIGRQHQLNHERTGQDCPKCGKSMSKRDGGPFECCCFCGHTQPKSTESMGLCKPWKPMVPPTPEMKALELPKGGLLEREDVLATANGAAASLIVRWARHIQATPQEEDGLIGKWAAKMLAAARRELRGAIDIYTGVLAHQGDRLAADLRRQFHQDVMVFLRGPLPGDRDASRIIDAVATSGTRVVEPASMNAPPLPLPALGRDAPSNE